MQKLATVNGEYLRNIVKFMTACLQHASHDPAERAKRAHTAYIEFMVASKKMPPR